MKRQVLDKLRAWRTSKRRKPLVVRGARQVGKTWAIREFGKEFDGGVLYVNFDKQEEFKQFFQTTKDVKRILSNLSLAVGQKVTADTLIFFDEVQACEDALNSLKYFCEDAPEYCVVAAGSLLGLQLTKGFPVGKVDFLDMGAMNFTEFLLACGDEQLVDYIDSIEDFSPIPDAFFNPLVEKLKSYFVVGGMPEAVQAWAEDGDIAEADRILGDILTSYQSDFAKHTDGFETQKISLVWNSLPSQLAKENKKFLYSVVREGARAREYENAVNWLVNADLVRKVYRITKPGLPLAAYDDIGSFKLYMGDVGLLRKHSYLATNAFAEKNRLFTEFKGALTENYVLQSLSTQTEPPLRYWANAPYEVDFVVQYDNFVVPVECKAGTDTKLTSLKAYARTYAEQTPLVVRMSLSNLSLDGNVLNLPLFLADKFGYIVGLALKKLQK